MISAVDRIADAEMLVELVEGGGVSQAARRLGRSQPAVSRQLAALEARLGVRLLERTTRQMRVTAAGRAYFERCRELLALLREAEDAAVEASGTLRGVLRLSAPPTYARKRIVPLLPGFSRDFPELRLEVVSTGERIDLLREGLDLVVRLGPLGDSTLVRRLLSAERFVLCASPGYLERHGVPGAIGELASRRCLVTRTFGMRDRWRFARGRQRREVEVAAALVSDDLGVLHEAALAGLGPSALPEYLVGEDLRSGALRRLLPRERLPSFPAYALLPSARHVPRRVRAFLDALASRLRREAVR